MIYKFDKLDSTNKYALDNYKEYRHLDVVCAVNQTGGRGRLGRVWECNDSIAMTIILKDTLNFNLGLVSFVAAAALYNIINKYTNNVSIKWPNDIYALNCCGNEALKLSGILSEAVLCL